MSALPALSDLSVATTKATLLSFLDAQWKSLAQLVARGTTGASTASDAELLAARNTLGLPAVRQTVLSGPVDTAGLPSFGGSTGSGTVTASGTLVATAANGNQDRVGSITNPSWTGLTTNGTMYLYLDIAASGACTTGSTTLAPTYRWGGADVVTNGQFTYNIQEAVGKVGNGASAAQTYRVFVGQVTVAGSVVTAIVWYALQGRYDSGFTATLPGTSTQVSKNHNIGVTPEIYDLVLENTTTEHGYAVGTRIKASSFYSYEAAARIPLSVVVNPTLVFLLCTGTVSAFEAQNSSGLAAVLTAARWKYKFIAMRGW